jgi:hypothetical protein
VKKNIPSILEGCIDDLDIDALLDDTKNDISPDDAASIPKPDEQRIYSHGYTVRINLMVPDPEARLALIGWAEDSNDWIRCKTKYGERRTLRGSTFLTQRSPRLKKQGSTAIAKLNKKLRTKLYTIEFDRPCEGHSFLVLRGVRHTDVERLLELHMGVSSSEYEIAYYLDLERFIVVPPHVALRLAEELEGQPEAGRGRVARKRWLVKNYKIPIRIRSHTRRMATLSIYRVDGGATAQYKIEISLKGRRQNKSHFAQEDIAALDAILHQLIQEHDLHPVSKPERWEPRRAPQWRRDGRLARLPAKAYRGTKVPQERIQAARNGHTPNLRFCINSVASSAAYPGRPLIRNVGVGKPPRRLPSPAWRRLAEDVAQYEGYLTEIVLQAEQDPQPLVEAIVKHAGGAAAVGVVGADLGQGVETWHSVRWLVDQYPCHDGTKTLVVVLDVSSILAVDEAMQVGIGGSLHAFRPGPLHPNYWKPEWDVTPLYVHGLAAFFSPMLEELRGLCEATGFRVVLITVDARTEHGRGGLRKGHYYTDARVRSHIGDAGRHWAHLRYLVESDEDGWPTWAALTKDEGQGLPGRMLWGMAAEA